VTQIGGRIRRPDLLDHVDRFDQHAVALRRIVIAQELEIRQQAARADAQDETAAAHLIELRSLAGDDGGVAIGQRDDTGAEGKLAGPGNEARHEHQRGGVRLGRGRVVLAQEHLIKAEPVGEQRLVEILGEILIHWPMRRMDRHHEKPETHRSLPIARAC
jgi:hypothetical protein